MFEPEAEQLVRMKNQDMLNKVLGQIKSGAYFDWFREQWLMLAGDDDAITLEQFKQLNYNLYFKKNQIQMVASEENDEHFAAVFDQELGDLEEDDDGVMYAKKEGVLEWLGLEFLEYFGHENWHFERYRVSNPDRDLEEVSIKSATKSETKANIARL